MFLTRDAETACGINGLPIVGEAVAGEQVLALIQPLEPDLLIFTHHLSLAECLELGRMAHQHKPGLRIAILNGPQGTQNAAEDQPVAARASTDTNTNDRNLEKGTLAEQIGKLSETIILEALRYSDKSLIQNTIVRCMMDLKTERAGIFFYIHAYINLILTMVQFVTELGGQAEQVLPELADLAKLLPYLDDERRSLEYLETLLDKTLQFRESKRMKKYYEVIRKAKDFIHLHFADPNLSLNAVADFVNMSPSHFCTIFGRETGETLIQYLTHIRIKKAMELLKTTNLSTAEIAAKIGYNDSNYFCHIFKKTTGINARDFRNGND